MAAQIDNQAQQGFIDSQMFLIRYGCNIRDADFRQPKLTYGAVSKLAGLPAAYFSKRVERLVG